MTARTAARPIEIWGGAECTVNRVGDQYFDQIERSGHGTRNQDLARFADLGLKALRFPVLWERVAPESLDSPDWSWTDAGLSQLRALGLRPIVGLLHHGSGPRATSLLDPAFPSQLARYAGLVARRYPWVRDYTPVNEPLTTARFSGLYGHWYPHERSDHAFVRALINQVRGTALAMAAIRAVNPAARLIQTEDCGRVFGTRSTRIQATFENRRRWLTWDLLTGRVDAAHPLCPYLLAHGATPEELDDLRRQTTPPQVLGLNYYVTSDRLLDHRLDRYPASLHGGNAWQRYADVDAVRGRGRGMHGHGAHLLDAWRRYELPVALTEVHLGCTHDEQARWLADAWDGAHLARARGADVVAITPWALLGSYDWDSLVTRSRGHYESGAFDIRGREPRPTAVARTIQQMTRGERPVSAVPPRGWWNRPGRLLCDEPPRPTRHSEEPERPLLILGSSGTLGTAFHRIAADRGLAPRGAPRGEADITNADAIHRLVEHAKPWAVVNAAGFVRVDDAERECDACFDVNTAGAVHVATACREAGVPLLTWSSDLVFDGERDHPYTEHDTPRPLNVYGASKAEAERRVLDVLPNALVVRTSAFFGPWDTSNFAVRTLDALERGDTLRAATDVVVSPTYVPELVHAALDLLLDDEHGIWHLTNDGALSWFAFARATAIACGVSTDLIQPAVASDLGWPAVRPVYSALTSVRGQVMRSTADAIAAFATSRAATAHARA